VVYQSAKPVLYRHPLSPHEGSLVQVVKQGNNIFVVRIPISISQALSFD
jgi:hypothetical protein